MGFNANGTRELGDIFGQGGVFPQPKPTMLIEFLLEILRDKDAIVLDSFAGSGTTAHAVLALNKRDGGNRKFILVECEDYADGITAERVRRVIAGVPEARDEDLRDGLDGSFAYCTLGPPIEEEGMLAGEALPQWGALAAYLLHAASGVSVDRAELAQGSEDEPFHTAGGNDYWLFYRPDLEDLRGDDLMLNAERAKRVAAVSGGSGRKAIVFGPGKYMSQRDLTDMGVVFCQLPWELYRAG